MKATAILLMLLTLLLVLMPFSPLRAQDADPDAELKRVLDASRAEATRIRGLPFLMDVPVKKIGPDDFQKQMMRDIRRAFGEGDQLARMEKLLQVLRVLPEGMTIEKLTTDFFPETVAANYDPTDKKISFLKAYRNPALMQKVMVHELTHALQDQHYNLGHMVLSGELTFDRLLALGALVEGDAKDVELLFSPEGQFLKNAPLEMIKAFGMAQVTAYLSRMKDFPRGVARPFIFQYLDGLVFIEAIKRAGGGFAAVDLVYRDPPASTEQILHPERYLERDRPTTIAPPELPEGFEVLVANTLGELGVSIVLTGHLGPAYRESMAAGWDGDRIMLLGIGGQEPVLAWYTTWDSVADAEEFTAAAIDLLRIRRPEAEERLREDGRGATRTAEGLVQSVSREGKDVLLLESVPAGRYEKIALALSGAMKEELRVHREPFGGGK